MSTASSIVGTWNTFVDWGSTGHPILANPLTFNADGTWTYNSGGGRWLQIEGQFFFNFTNAAGLIYVANTTLDCVSGIMGYPTPGGSNGVWWGTRPGAPHAADQALHALAAKGAHDALIGPHK
jgi:hypothetical protein